MFDRSPATHSFLPPPNAVLTEKVVLVTGSLAEPRLKRLSGELLSNDMEIVVSNIGVKVAALMTTEIVERRLALPDITDRVIMPGRFRGDIERLSDFFGTRFEGATASVRSSNSSAVTLRR